MTDTPPAEDTVVNGDLAKLKVRQYQALIGLVVLAVLVTTFVLSSLQSRNNYSPVHFPKQNASFEGADFIFDLTTQMIDSERPTVGMREADNYRFDMTVTSPQGEFPEQAKHVLEGYFPVVNLLNERQERTFKPTAIKLDPVMAEGKVMSYKGSADSECPMHFRQPVSWQLKWLKKTAP